METVNVLILLFIVATAVAIAVQRLAVPSSISDNSGETAS